MSSSQLHSGLPRKVRVDTLENFKSSLWNFNGSLGKELLPLDHSSATSGLNIFLSYTDCRTDRRTD